jgi:LAS superfamily LD-carboxypeptidase LdcB
MSVEAKVGLMRIQQKFGKQLTVISAYRSTEKQARLFAAAVQKYGSEKAARKKVAPPGSSKHEGGTALDISWSGYPSNRNEFIQFATEAGFKGIGLYTSDGFVHIDLGPERQWGS